MKCRYGNVLTHINTQTLDKGLFVKNVKICEKCILWVGVDGVFFAFLLLIFVFNHPGAANSIHS